MRRRSRRHTLYLPHRRDPSIVGGRALAELVERVAAIERHEAVMARLDKLGKAVAAADDTAGCVTYDVERHVGKVREDLDAVREDLADVLWLLHPTDEGGGPGLQLV